MFKFISLFAVVALVVSTEISYSADAERGRDVAARWCASCHLISPDQQGASDIAAQLAAGALGTGVAPTP
jgi:hypothetical protein